MGIEEEDFKLEDILKNFSVIDLSMLGLNQQIDSNGQVIDYKKIEYYMKNILNELPEEIGALFFLNTCVIRETVPPGEIPNVLDFPSLLEYLQENNIH
ncbi:hypothetical protein A3K02_01875 [candidate division WS6 bacterium RIFOXYD1_FULL_33_8]|uniref:Uncharacterized protein n=2 Tax=Candidatus Dojkabacteria TaxID=74243 RepID=A0A0G0CUH6_9BACT|nr:MAG: hypothetical protein UR32_C0023G0002 [candidate division WS6 bacterium GW2011_GWE2_33_157]KKP44106.1 MAG: hypothetical protein UR36_C0020G0002 [candidate division WS6 bacterium GW2011_GWF1_33_233]KKP44421.1 MAG: hypothetical protein UR34_C0003G0047 [candidate division WS6 bacterium GW2011_GWC1_33_20]KKP53281.1 MAG: hypothetical protein UR45_C0029G0002 [candidate division WS6 bacterium GW2011_WS6_33_547]KKP54755.1 MAG: hypothetical protein UR47_C0011G0004 [candidate division WS6 bacteriu